MTLIETMPALYPEIEPYEHGLLEVGGGHRLYYELCGNPAGVPVVGLHGGPGSGCTPGMRRFFNPAVYRIILFDQRNCGRSRPHASDPAVDLTTNTTGFLLADIEHLREHLHVEHWLVFGISWGSTLALTYAQQFPARVSGIILAGVTMTRPAEIDWLYRGVAPMFPAEWARFRAGVPEPDRNGNLVEAYRRLLDDPDPAIRLKAAQDWHAWEAASVSVDPDAQPSPRWSDPAYILARARIITHYFSHHAWLEDGSLLRNAHRLNGIPGSLIHGRLDLGAPFVTAWELAQVWNDSELIVVKGAGHSTGDPGMTAAIVRAADDFAHRLTGS